MTARIYSEKDPTETITYAVDFSALVASGDSLSTATVAVSVDVGTDASSASLLFGTSTITGALVKQLITGGVDGVTYRLNFRATTTASCVYAGVVYLPVNSL